MNRSGLLTTMLGLVMVVAIATGAYAAPPNMADSVITLSTDKSAFGSADKVIVRVTLSNPNSEPLHVLSYLIPGEDLTTPLFTVTIDGEQVAYLGIEAKRMPPRAQDYLTLAGGQSVSFDVDLSRYYAFPATGNYRISYRVQSSALYALDDTARAAGRMQSNELSVHASARADKAVVSVAPDVVTGPSTFTGCTADRQAQLTTARNDASVYANEVATYFASNRTGARYVKWFGVYVDERWNTVKSHFDLIRTAVDTATVDFDCNCNVANPDTVFAYVFPSQPYRIHLCGSFWRTTPTGTDSRAGTLIHELSHFTILGGTNDFVYGQSAAMSLAASNPANAVFNADNHEYFAENTPATPDDGVITTTLLSNGVPASGLTGAAGSETRFSIDVPAGSTNLAIRIAGGSGDPDLYVRRGAAPTLGAFDCESDEIGPTDQCLFASPGAGTWQILVFGFTQYSGLTLTATFVAGSQPALTVARTGTGSGTVTSNPAGINCGSTCNASFNPGTQVTLTAEPAPGSTFSGWSGDCSGTQRACTTTVSSARNISAVFTLGSLGSGIDEPGLARFSLPAPNPPNANCPSGFFSVVVDDGPAAGVTAGTFGMEVLLDAPGTRVLAGGLNFGGLIDTGQVGFAGFSIANDANEQQTLNLSLTGSPSDSASGSLAVRIRIGRRPDANTNLTVFEANATISLASAYQTSLALPPGFYEVTVAPVAGTAGGNAEGQFFFSLTTSFVNRPGGGFQGGAVLGGYHTAHPFGGVSGFAAFCLATPHSTSIRVLSQPSYGAAGARDLRLRAQNAQQQELVVVPGS